MEKKVFGKAFLKHKTIATIRKLRSKEVFTQWLLENYDVIRCFHGCRPTNIESYYQNGFLPSDFDKAKSDFSKFLSMVNYNDDYDISHVIETYSGTIDKLIYFILDEQDFLYSAPHYIIYGSELMLSLAQNVDEYLKYKLRKIGIPTIFQCDIPLSMISEEELTPIYERILNTQGNLNQKLNDIFSNYSIVISSKLDSKHISSHKHPTEVIYDFHAQERYKNTIEKCPFCN